MWDKLKESIRHTANTIQEKLDDPQVITITHEPTKEAVTFVTNVINSNFVSKISSAAHSVLDITEKIKTGNAFSLAAAGLASINVISEFLESEEISPADEYATRHSLVETTRGRLTELINSPSIVNRLAYETVHRFEKSRIDKVALGENNFIYIEKHDGTHEVGNSYYIDKSFSIEEAYRHIWSLYGGKAFLIKESSRHADEPLQLMPLVFDTENIKIDASEVDKIGAEIVRARENKISRSYLLIGPAGVGKSSLCYVVASQFCPRVLKVDPSVMGRMHSGELESFIFSIQPDAIIFDDIDRASNHEGYLLTVLEHIKKQAPKIVIFASANAYEKISKALRRPGRFDRILWVDNPSLAAREEFFRYFIDRMKLDVPKYLFDMMLYRSEGFSQAYLSEMLYRLKNDVDMKSSIIGSIREFRKTLELDADDAGGFDSACLPHLTTDMSEEEQEFYFDEDNIN